MIQLNTGLLIGGDAPTRVNCNVGCNRLCDYDAEVAKLRLLKSEGVLPDMMMDLSLVEFEVPLYFTIKDELKLPFGTVLSYHEFSKDEGLRWEKAKDKFVRLCEEGISFVTIHFTADSDLYNQARNTRHIAMTSRGGGIVLYDNELNHRKQNIFRENIDELINIALKYDVAISLGTTFRPGTVLDACDEVHIEETKRQLAVCKYLQSKDVKVFVENIGHISFDKLSAHVRLLKQFNAPIMPLGPLPTDVAVNQDHIANAVGGAYAAFLGAASIINCVTRYEHTQSAITPEATMEAIRTARLATHIADVARGIPDALQQEAIITHQRTSLHSCFADGRSCTRCSIVCPLKLLKDD